MGKGNWLPKGIGNEIADYGGNYVDIFEGIEPEEWDRIDIAIEELKQTVVTSMMDMFPSYFKVKKWEHDGVVILENNLAQVIIGDNENSMAVYVVIPDSERFPYSELGKKQLKRYLAGLQSILLKYYSGQVRIRTGPWTTGILRVAM